MSLKKPIKIISIVVFSYLLMAFIINGKVVPAINSEFVTISKIDNSVFNNKGQVTGDFFYEKPNISNVFSGAEKINSYFEKDINDFFNGTALFFGDDAFYSMRGLLKEGIKRHGEDSITKHPFRYCVKTNVEFLSDEYVSFHQKYIWAAEGPEDVWGQGLTFSLKTGELVPFTQFVNIDSEEFKDILYSKTISLFDKKTQIQKEIFKMFYTDISEPFTIEYEGKKIHLDKQFFYDGEFINVVLNDGFYPHSGLIFKWKSNNLSSGELHTEDSNRQEDGSIVFVK